MPYQIAWHVEKRIVMVKMFGLLSDNEANEIGQINSQRLAEGIAPVHMIVDTTELEKFPTNLRQNSQFMAYLRAPSLGWVIVIGLTNNVLAKFAVSVISQVIKFRLAERQSVADALTFLQGNDPTLKLNHNDVELA
jgi:hypothetical protein